MRLFDSHSHINHDEFDDAERAARIREIEEDPDLCYVMDIGCDMASSVLALLVALFPPPALSVLLALVLLVPVPVELPLPLALVLVLALPLAPSFDTSPVEIEGEFSAMATDADTTPVPSSWSATSSDGLRVVSDSGCSDAWPLPALPALPPEPCSD